VNDEQRKAGFFFGAEGDDIVEQFRGLVELARWCLVFLLAAYSLLIPLFGIIFGIILMKFATVTKNRRLGKLCLILSLVSLGLFIACWLIWLIMALVGGAASFIH